MAFCRSSCLRVSADYFIGVAPLSREKSQTFKVFPILFQNTERGEEKPFFVVNVQGFVVTYLNSISNIFWGTLWVLQGRVAYRAGFVLSVSVGVEKPGQVLGSIWFY